MMRTGLRPIVSAALLSVLAAACSGETHRAGADWDCADIAGAELVAGRNAPRFILVGEFDETNEAPAAFAELACHVARKRNVMVGLLTYAGGATDAEARMRTRLDGLVAKGAPIEVVDITEARAWTARNRTANEKAWAAAILAQADARNAERVMLLLPRVDAQAAAVPAMGERFAGYEPMALHLPDGGAMSLEVARAASGADAPQVRLHGGMRDGFDGEVVLTALTRPALPLPEAPWTQAAPAPAPRGSVSGGALAALSSQRNTLQTLRADFEAAAINDPDAPRERLSEVIDALDAELKSLDEAMQNIRDAERAAREPIPSR